MNSREFQNLQHGLITVGFDGKLIGLQATPAHRHDSGFFSKVNQNGTYLSRYV